MTQHAGAAGANRQFATGLARAFAGAILFGLPLLMTMEMWWLGFYIPPWKLALLLVLFLPFLVVLSWHAGFEETLNWKNDVVDALVAYAVGCSSSLVALSLLGILDTDMSFGELAGKVALQAIPASIGALLAQSQLGEESTSEASSARGPAYASELFIMAAGAMFLAFNVAPTQEMLAIASKLSPARSLLLGLVSLGLMHAFVYSVAFRGAPRNEQREPGWSLFLRFTVVGYALALVLSAFLLWSFGRLDGAVPLAAVQAIVVLGLPAAVGAAAARLIL